MVPLHDGVLLRKVKLNNKTKGGLIIPDHNNRNDDEDGSGNMVGGVVKSYGPGCKDVSGTVDLIPSAVLKVGKAYLLSKLGNYENTIGGEVFLLCRLRDVKAELEEGEWINE